MTLAGLPHRSGPASVMFYGVPQSYHHLPGLNLPPEFRAELSKAFSTVYHLKPHALVLSYLEQKPLYSYVDELAYALSDSYYTHPDTPRTDAIRTKKLVVGCRQLRVIVQKGNKTSW